MANMATMYVPVMKDVPPCRMFLLCLRRIHGAAEAADIPNIALPPCLLVTSSNIFSRLMFIMPCRAHLIHNSMNFMHNRAFFVRPGITG
ncbi:hypothetical protein MPTK1_4g08340 [Marchantia polymorpha subsp. ruderalis]|uniref:Uncharacterized protein n=2 Tax=Marchantia polymorpha TaxID=3197 RepID=A0AAF6B7Q9_MARPO|nr:hypothetical protein MARPO_0120s0012 [Marchantia polymorpha]BBN08043.1 hypothetical protein Mp_4g08340 [Marchantia polymorpha subsp. ruderalis]|eukprot:PTQ30729.1 hypothetical protein MARPO_0120s0012 [Marchantia polymorpha]